jgi:adenosylhomocysteine nucleosidase
VTTLVVAALHEEVAHLPDDVEVLVTGVGKARAAAGLARRLVAEAPPKLVVNVGTAGAVDGLITGLVEVGYVTQHDFPYDAIDLLLASPQPRGYVLSPTAPPLAAHDGPGDVIWLATADQFVADTTTARRLAGAGLHVVDMEAFALAAVCAEVGVPLRVVKVVSDSADEDASMSWLDTIDACARSLGEWVAQHIR